MTYSYDEVTRPIAFQNTSGEEVPGFAVMEVVGVDTDGNVTIDKPTATTDLNMLLINSRVAVPDNGYGVGYSNAPYRVLYTGGTPAVGEVWRPSAGWEMEKGQETDPFPIWGQTDGTSVVVGKAQPTSFFRAKITSRTNEEYSWVEVEGDTSGNWSTVSGGRTGTAGGDNPAFEENQSEANIDVSGNMIVWMTRGEMISSSSYAYYFNVSVPPDTTQTHHPIDATDDEWDRESAPANTAGFEINNVLLANGDRFHIEVDSLGHWINALQHEAADDSASDEPGGGGPCDGGPYTGTYTVLQDFSITDFDINSNWTVTISWEKIVKTICVYNGLTMVIGANTITGSKTLPLSTAVLNFICLWCDNSSTGSLGGTSSEEGVAVDCCSNTIPTTLIASLTSLNGYCTGFTGQTIDIVWDGIDSWVGTDTFCGESITLTLKCPGGSSVCTDFTLVANTSCALSPTTPFTPNVGCACDPLFMEFDFRSLACGCCTSSGPISGFRVGVSEVI